MTANYNRYLSALDAVAELIVSDQPGSVVQADPLPIVQSAAARRNGGVKKIKAPKAPKASKPAKRNADEMLPIIAAIPQPFSPTDLINAASISKKNASNWLLRLKTKGLLKSVGYGQWERTAKFPNFPKAETPRPVVTLPGDTIQISLEQKLAQARAELAAAQKAGHQTLADILTDKVANLEERLAAAK